MGEVSDRICPLHPRPTLAQSVAALKIQTAVSAVTGKWFFAIRTLTMPRLYSPICGTLTSQALTIGVASMSLRKRLRASNRQRENRGLKRKKISQHQFRAVQNFLGCPHPENCHALNDRSTSRQVSPTTPHESPTATAAVKKFFGMNGRTQPTQRDAPKPTAKFTSTPTV